MERLFYHPESGPTPLPAHFRGGQAVWFNSNDGTRLHGWFIPAQSKLVAEGESAAALAPTIVHVHGNAGNILSHIWFTEYLPNAGFNLFLFDYRGYGQSKGRARSRRPLIEDTHAAINYLLTRSDVDVRRIGMYGQSLGGSIALNVMAERQDIRAAVIESAFASWREIAACAIGGNKPGFLCTSISTVLISDSHRPDHAISNIHRPVLLIHGDADTIIPVEHSRQLAKASAGSAKLIEVPGGEHNSLRDTHPEIESLVIDFFNSALTE